MQENTELDLQNVGPSPEENNPTDSNLENTPQVNIQDKETPLNHVQNSDFVEFSKAIKKDLSDRLNNHPYVKAKRSEKEKYNQAKDQYNNIVSAN